jgi:hypothetical protein
MSDLLDLPTTLLDLLNNAVILRHLSPYLPIASALSLCSTSKTVRALLQTSPDAFRYLDLSRVRSAIIANTEPIDRGGQSFRAERMDENLTEDEFYSGPIRGIFSKLNRQNTLKNVQVLVLDGLSIPAELVQEIISTPRFHVRILSIREAQHLNERQLMHALKYAVRPSRPKGTPTLRGIYIFGPKDSEPPVSALYKANQSLLQSQFMTMPGGIMAEEGAQIGAQWNMRSQQTLSSELTGIEDRVYQPTGRLLPKTPLSGWADVLFACEGIIAFDAVLCRGPQHNIDKIAASNGEESENQWRPPALASIALGPTGCDKCHAAPEGAAHIGSSPSHHLPLVGNAPTHSTSIAAAQIPSIAAGSSYTPLYLRCEDCARGRWCEKCSRWWCEDCFEIPTGNKRTSEVSESDIIFQQPSTHTKLYMGLCIEHCLVGEMMSGAGSSGM